MSAKLQPDNWLHGEPVDNLVSVIVPAYNAGELIGETLDSIFRQSYRDIEVIVVDDGSTDNTAEVVQKSPQPVLLLRQPNSGGCSVPRNHGLRFAKGEFVTFFDADDVMTPDKIKSQVRFMRSNPPCDIVLMDYRNFDESGPASSTHFQSCEQLRSVAKKVGKDEFVLDSAEASRILITENFAIAGSPLIRRTAFVHVDAFDESLRASEDFDLIYRFARYSGLGIIAKTGFMRRYHDANMSKRTGHVLRYKIESRKKLLQSEKVAANRALFCREIAHYHLSVAESEYRKDPFRSLQHVWSALRLGYPPNLRVVKDLANCTLSAIRPA